VKEEINADTKAELSLCLSSTLQRIAGEVNVKIHWFFTSVIIEVNRGNLPQPVKESDM